ncbi:FxsA family protein [endosymbiont of unidentified scaly snail isolate Monju]|uniref:FxsA family protein n=1 Tax=endosymbiont of unidentified scaly snail isolate Monju TaxID=1248727 RepID=UPI0003892445|nr:FxsA family protein [endosymbiont of unidentified scaly snail isolate Monju]BAN69824.1 hypothetical protein EBS_1961 [endosymbiont of unidentified scaly snail isolate Monju]
MIHPLLLFLAIFVIAPLVELYVLIEVGARIGAFSTIALSVFTAVLGGWLVRLQGFAVLYRVQGTMARGEVPALELLEGAMLLLTGLALLLPGFITDAVGFALLIPPLRRALILWYLRRNGTLRPGPPPPRPPSSGGFIEGDFRRDD